MKKKLSKQEKIILAVSVILIVGSLSIIFSVKFSRNIPYPVALIQDTIILDIGSGNFLVNISVEALGSDLIFNGNFDITPTVVYIEIDSTLPLSILEGELNQIIFMGSFFLGTEYALNLVFLAGESNITNVAIFTP